MARKLREDVLGAYHHITCRGVERRTIFIDDEDRRAFVERFQRLCGELDVTCIAWALLGNHFHLLVRRNGAPIAKLMARLNSWYAQRFNRRHARVGHLFQDRYVSRVISSDADLLNTAKYVLFNPVKHGVLSRGELHRYRWCAYSALAGARAPRAFESVREALALFGRTTREARVELAAVLRDYEPPAPPERVVADLAARECAASDLPRAQLPANRRLALDVLARICFIATRELGIRAVTVARALGISSGRVARAVTRRERTNRDNGV